MSANRKLQTEIAQLLKKVEEGVVLFDDIWEKVYSAGQQSLKEKYEGDLKKEIKKLQRLRDQIKTWLGGNEIKDKAPLTEARKVIESKMEQFKVCEKDTKTKAYSKEGLARDAKLDPKEAAKEEKRDWLNDCLDRLADLVDSIEADIEKIPNKKKSKDQVDKFENRIKKNKWHIARLEQVLKLMENDDLDPSKIDKIKEDVEYYIESAADDDGSTGVDDEFDIYEELALDSFGGDKDEATSSSAASDAPESAEASPKPSDAPEEKAAASAPALAAPAPVSAPAAAAPKKAPVSTASILGIGSIGKPQPAASLAKSTPATAAATAASSAGAAGGGAAATTTAKAAPLVSAKPAASPLATIGTKAPVPPGGPGNLTPSKSVTPALTAAAVVAGGSASSGASSAVTGKKASSKSLNDDGDEDTGGPATSWATAAAGAGPKSAASAAAATATAAASAAATASAAAAATTATAAAAAATATAAVSATAAASATASAGIGGAAASSTTSTSGPQGSGKLGGTPAQDLSQQISSSVFGSAASGGAIGSGIHSAVGVGGLGLGGATLTQAAGNTVPQLTRSSVALSNEVLVAAHMLKQSLVNSPETAETDRQAGFVPRTPYASHPSFPTKPPSTLETTALFERLPPDSLFFAFYYQQGSYQQYLAAKQLKKQSWRFHKKYMTWFQRHEEPKIATDDYEEGTYVYFDYESGWCQLLKSEFKFEFAFLEDELPV